MLRTISFTGCLSRQELLHRFDWQLGPNDLWIVSSQISKVRVEKMTRLAYSGLLNDLSLQVSWNNPTSGRIENLKRRIYMCFNQSASKPT